MSYPASNKDETVVRFVNLKNFVSFQIWFGNEINYDGYDHFESEFYDSSTL